MKQIFCLEWGTYDCSVEFYLLAPEGTTQEDFKKLCDSLLDVAAYEACLVKGLTWGGIPDDFEDREPAQVGWNSIVHVLAVNILPKYGYEVVSLPTVSYNGSTIISDKEYDNEESLLSEEAFNFIKGYNDKIEQDSRERMRLWREEQDALKAQYERTSEQVVAELEQD